MTKKRTNDRAGGFFLILLCLCALNVLQGILSLEETDEVSCNSKVYVKVSGDIRHPGVYGFLSPPDLEVLFLRAGGLSSMRAGAVLPTDIEDNNYRSGVSIEVLADGQTVRILKGEMSAFCKATLEIPISLNAESREGLTAIRGIGPRIAGVIVAERAKRGGFHRLDELLSIKGIGPGLYRRISPYLTL